MAHQEPLRVVLETSEPWWRAWLDPGLTIITIIVGFGIVAYQLHRQFQNDLQVQAENQKNEYRLALYRTLAEAIDDASKALISFGGWGRRAVTELNSRRIVRDSSLRVGHTSHRFKDLGELHRLVSDTVLRITGLLERNEVGLPEFDILREALLVQLARVGKAFTDFSREIIMFLSLDLTPDQAKSVGGVPAIGPAKVPTGPDLSKLDLLADALHDEALTLTVWLVDLTVEAQNELLTPLFRRKAVHRAPPDPKHKVITRDTEKREELRRYIKERSPYPYSQQPSTRQGETESGARPAPK